MLSEPESDLGSPETENLEIENNDQSNEKQEVKQEIVKESTE